MLLLFLLFSSLRCFLLFSANIFLQVSLFNVASAKPYFLLQLLPACSLPLVKSFFLFTYFLVNETSVSYVFSAFGSPLSSCKERIMFFVPKNVFSCEVLSIISLEVSYVTKMVRMLLLYLSVSQALTLTKSLMMLKSLVSAADVQCIKTGL